MSGDAGARRSRLAEAGPGPSRRIVMAGGGAVVLAALAGCGLRLDLPPPPPPVPTRRRAADEALLVALVRDLDEVLGRWPRAGKNRSLATCQTLVDQQRAVLFGRLTNEGVPTAEITAGPQRTSAKPPATASGDGSPSGSPSGFPSTPPATTSAQPLAPPALAAELSGLPTTHAAATARATAATRDLLTAAYGTLLTCAGLLGQDVLPHEATTTARQALAERTGPLVYAFEVIAAQSSKEQRTRAIAALDRLRALDRRVATAGATGGIPGGWSLPFPVTDQASAKRLGDSVLSLALEASADLLGASPDAAAVEDVARWVASVQLAANEWGLAPTAFPGLAT